MPSSSNKKLSIFYVLEVLKDFSDENHLLSQNEIAKKIYSLYGMECERKSIGASIDSLIDCGFDIVKSQNGSYLASREFEPSEVQFLVDAVFSSKSIDSRHAKEISKKLSGFLSKYQRKNYNYVFKADELNRTDSKDLFYNIEVLSEAIERKKQVQFEYKRFSLTDNDLQKKPRVVNPYALINNNGRYYLVCNYTKFNDMANYKIELISNIQILETEVKPVTEIEGFEKGFDATKYANDNVYMFGSSKTVSATLKIENDYAQAYINDWFKNYNFYSKDGQLFANVTANENALVYWCLQYGESVELIEPTILRKKIFEIIEKMYKKYG